MISALDISTSAMVAQRIRLNTISSNIANITTTLNENGENEPYRRREVIFQTDNELVASGDAVGVKVSEVKTDTAEPQLRYLPDHPLADGNGNVKFPNIDWHREFVNALEATRAYEANVGVIEVTKNLGQQTLRIVG